MNIDFCIKNYISNYDLLIEQLKKLEKDNAFLDTLSNETKDKKWIRCVGFNKLLDDEYFNLFVEMKIKLFSHKNDTTKKISESLFGEELSLKKVFNNRDDSTKFILWYYLHLMVLMVEMAQKNRNKDRVNILTNLIEKNTNELEKCKTIQDKNDPKQMIKQMLNIDLNDQTNDMLSDIISSFETSMNTSNPLSGIMDISQKISSKYQDKINNGDIELNKIMEGFQKNIPGMGDLLKNVTGDLGDMFGKKEEPKETIIINDEFSTANVELGKENNKNSGMNIGKLLNVANSMGVLPGSSDTSPLLGLFNMKGNDDASNNPMGKIDEMFKMFEGGNMEDLKNNMDNFLLKQGIDVSKLNEQISNMMEQNKDKITEQNDLD